MDLVALQGHHRPNRPDWLEGYRVKAMMLNALMNAFVVQVSSWVMQLAKCVPLHRVRAVQMARFVATRAEVTG